MILKIKEKSECIEVSITEESNVIPKKIHYCWFGHIPLPDLALKCIASWKKYLPDYEGYDWKQLSKMTHLEPFTRPVWDIGKMTESYGGEDSGAAKQRAERQGNPGGNTAVCGFALFDYRRRNPLTCEAAAHIVNLQETEDDLP